MNVHDCIKWIYKSPGYSPKLPVQERLKLEFIMDFASKITFLHMTSRGVITLGRSPPHMLSLSNYDVKTRLN